MPTPRVPARFTRAVLRTTAPRTPFCQTVRALTEPPDGRAANTPTNANAVTAPKGVAGG